MICLTDEELVEMETHARGELEKVTDRRNKELEDLYRKLDRVMADLDFLIKDKLNLLRTGVYTAEQVMNEEIRLNLLIEAIRAKITKPEHLTPSSLKHVRRWARQIAHGYKHYDGTSKSFKQNFEIRCEEENCFEFIFTFLS